jgi:hypothetical protein
MLKLKKRRNIFYAQILLVIRNNDGGMKNCRLRVIVCQGKQNLEADFNLSHATETLIC